MDWRAGLIVCGGTVGLVFVVAVVLGGWESIKDWKKMRTRMKAYRRRLYLLQQATSMLADRWSREGKRQEAKTLNSLWPRICKIEDIDLADLYHTPEGSGSAGQSSYKIDVAVRDVVQKAMEDGQKAESVEESGDKIWLGPPDDEVG